MTMADPLTTEEIVQRARALMPGVLEDLGTLIRYPSVAFPGYPAEPVHAMARATAGVLERYGLSGVRLVEIPGGYPAVYGEIPAPPGAPSLLLYAHYDVQPARQEDGWDADPWTPVEKDGRLYGRGAADNKSGILIIAAALKIFFGKPPVGVKVFVEGEEETTGHLAEFVRAHPEFFRCDLFVVADTGNIAVGDPVLTTTLRGEVSCIVDVRTLDRAVHSGSFGGPAPDALVALIRILSTLHDPEGNVAVKGLCTSAPGTAEYPEEAFRKNAGVLPGVSLAGTGPIGSRLWSKPSVTAIGIDAPSVSGSSNILIPRASAKVSLRIAPGADPRRELRILMDHLRAAVPWNARVDIRPDSASPGFVCPAGGPGLAAAKRALEAAFKKPAREKGTGGSIPLMQVLHDAVPGAEFVLWGAEDDAQSFIHGPGESVDTGELERFIVAQALLMREMGKR
jgi:acetylornithine deacetylase/succinyl-diaminopimelate desuccinylase-like protein